MQSEMAAFLLKKVKKYLVLTSFCIIFANELIKYFIFRKCQDQGSNLLFMFWKRTIIL